jgi:two-component system, NarL family, sensor histidine kinase UhpB
MTFELEVRDLPEDIGEALSTAAYRIVQEAVTNSLRHAQASRILITLVRDGELMVIQVRDDGRGLPSDWKAPGHYGLIGMQERATAIGGTLALQEAPGGGLTVTARLPLVLSTSPASHLAEAMQADGDRIAAQEAGAKHLHLNTAAAR